MKLRYEKNIRVLTNLMGYCRLLGAQNFSVDFTMDGSVSVIEVRAGIAAVDSACLAELSKTLNIPRQREVEQYYWNVSGEEEIDDELALVGMMVDRAAVQYANGVLTIRCERVETATTE